MPKKKEITCPNCDGDGWLKEGNLPAVKCPECDGKGKIQALVIKMKLGGK